MYTRGMPKERPLPKNAKLIPPDAQQVFRGVIFEVYQWQQTMFDGSSATFEMLRRPDTVDVIGVVDNQVLVLEQQQPDTGTFWCLPGGRVDPGEDIYETAKRETLEETGVEFKDWKLVHVIQQVPKIEYFAYTFVATNPVHITQQKLDAGEKIKVHKVDYSRLLELVRSSEINYMHYLKDKLLAGKTNLEDILNDQEIS